MDSSWSVKTDPELAPLWKAVQLVLRHGLRPAKLAGAPETFVLAGKAADGLDRLAAAQLVQERCLAALDLMGEGPAAEALRLLVGASPETRYRLLKTRRELAAKRLGLTTETFRRRHEQDLLEDFLATRLKSMNCD